MDLGVERSSDQNQDSSRSPHTWHGAAQLPVENSTEANQ
jgi:hypothetical protein